uniref:Odorant-binding protein 5 n=1 Tax=Cnaphalocrocis medinalis TaxID=437488 RepID=A0A0U3BYJ4_CNAME|nr:odorant-binding protein 5 [Cnaphalocrocis medinalis]
MIQYSLWVVCVFCILVNADPVSFINKCKADDDKCIKETTRVVIPKFTDGLPEYNVETLDPVFFKNIDSSSPTLKLLLDNVTVKNLKKCIPKSVRRDAQKAKLYLKIQCDATLDGHYDMNGRLLILSISGNGKIHVDLRKAVFDIEIDLMDKKGKDGKNHWQVKSWKYTYELNDKSTVYFENLLSGNPALAEAAKNVIAESGNEIIREVGSPVLKAVIGRIIENILHFFRAVPIEDLTLDN